MAMELLGEAGMTNEMKQFYDRKLLSVAEKDTVFLQYGVKRPIPPRGGKSIEFRRFERITVTEGSYTLTEGTPPTMTQGTITSVTATISQYGMYSQVSDVMETQSFDPIISEYVEKYGLAAAEALDIVARAEFANATTIQYADASTAVATGGGATTVGSGQYLDAAEIYEAVNTLRRNGARGQIRCFIHPDNKRDMFEDPDIVDAFEYAGARGPANQMFTGMVGKFHGVEFIETNNLKINSSYGLSGADIYEVVFFTPEFYAVTELSALSLQTIIHPRGTGGHSDPLEQYSTVGWKAAMVAKILNNDFGVLCYVNASRKTAA